MTTTTVPAAHSRLALVGAFAILYVVWGSTYLAIRFAIETMPPFLMASARFLLAGSLLYAWARFVSGAAKPTRAQWTATGVCGLLMLLGGNGLVVWAEFRVPSGVAALILAIEPACIVLLDWLRPRGTRPGAQVVIGLVAGLLGVAWLVGPESLAGAGRIDAIGATALVVAGVSWSLGTIYQRQAPMPASPALSTAMQMLGGGAGLLVVGAVAGEVQHLDMGAFSLRSLGAFFYLVVFGSIVAFSTYVWLLRASTPARASTFAYVNPVVAMLLGAALADEALTPRMTVAAAVIIGSVALITLSPKR